MFDGGDESQLDESLRWNIERNRNSLIHVRDNLSVLKGRQTAREGLIARMDFLFSNETMKQMICGSNALNIPELIERKQTLILNMHEYSEEQFIFVGTLLLNQIKAHFRFGKVREYQPLRVYIDECHNFLSQNILSLLKEGRKFKFSFVMATVDFSSIPNALVHALCNVGTLVAFQSGSQRSPDTRQGNGCQTARPPIP